MDLELIKGREFREELVQKIAVLESRLEKLRRFVGEYDRTFGGEGESPDQPIRDESSSPVHARPRGARHLTRTNSTRYDRIEEVLRLGGGPLTVSEIVDGLLVMGDGGGVDRSRFYNIVDAALRGGLKRGRYQRDATGSKAVWSKVEVGSSNGNGVVPSETKVGPILHQEGELENGEIGPDDPGNSGRLGAGDLFGFRIADAAKNVLSKSNGQWLDYRAVALEAFQRGYRGRDPLQKPEAAGQSFYHTMKRLPEVFESRGPVFKLRDGRGTE